MGEILKDICLMYRKRVIKEQNTDLFSCFFINMECACFLILLKTHPLARTCLLAGVKKPFLFTSPLFRGVYRLNFCFFFLCFCLLFFFMMGHRFNSLISYIFNNFYRLYSLIKFINFQMIPNFYDSQFHVMFRLLLPTLFRYIDSFFPSLLMTNKTSTESNLRIYTQLRYFIILGSQNLRLILLVIN